MPTPEKISDIIETSVDELGPPLIAEDLLLLLFDPSAGVIAGEGTLFWALGGAILTELALNQQVVLHDRGPLRSDGVATADDIAGPTDRLLRASWEQAANKSLGAQGFLALVGPHLRGPVLNRLVLRGAITLNKRKALGLIPVTKMRIGQTSRRDELVRQVRSILIDGATPEPRSGAITALWSATGTLPQFHGEIGWSADVATRAAQLQLGDWGADEAGAAVTRTAAAVVANSLIIASAISNR